MSSRLWYRSAPAGLLLGFVLGLVVSLVVVPKHYLIALALGLVLVVATAWWLSQVDATVLMRQPQDWQWQIEVEDSGVSKRTFNRVRHYFLEGERVLRITHQHLIVLLLNLSWLIFLFLACIVASVVLGTVHIGLPQHFNLHTQTSQTTPENRLPSIKPQLPKDLPALRSPFKLHWPKTLTIPWWLPLLPAGVLLLIGIRVWLAWVSWFFIITSDRLVVLELPFPIFPFAEEDDNPFPLGIIKRAEVKGSSFRKRWGLAIMNISTYLQPEEDAVIKDLFGLPQPDELKELINQLTRDNGDDMDKSLGSPLRELTTAVRENTEVMRRSFGQTKEGEPT